MGDTNILNLEDDSVVVMTDHPPRSQQVRQSPHLARPLIVKLSAASTSIAALIVSNLGPGIVRLSICAITARA